MQRVQELIQETKQNFSTRQSQEHLSQQSTKTKIDPVAEQRTQRLFAILGGLYGAKWTSQYPSTISQQSAVIQWSACLNHLTNEQMRIGVEALRKSDGKFPPSAPEFVRMCKPQASIQEQMYKEFKSLPKPDANPDIGKSAIEKMREALKK